MQIDTAVVLAILGAIGTAAATAIGKLFFALLAAKDAHLADKDATIAFQRGVINHSLGTTTRAVDLTDRIA